MITGDAAISWTKINQFYSISAPGVHVVHNESQTIAHVIGGDFYMTFILDLKLLKTRQ